MRYSGRLLAALSHHEGRNEVLRFGTESARSHISVHETHHNIDGTQPFGTYNPFLGPLTWSSQIALDELILDWRMFRKISVLVD